MVTVPCFLLAAAVPVWRAIRPPAARISEWWPTGLFKGQDDAEQVVPAHEGMPVRQRKIKGAAGAVAGLPDSGTRHQRPEAAWSAAARSRLPGRPYITAADG